MIMPPSLWDARGDLRPEKVRHELKASKLGDGRARIQVRISWFLDYC